MRPAPAPPAASVASAAQRLAGEVARSCSSTAASAPGRLQHRAQRVDAAGVEVRVAEQLCRTAPPRPATAASRASATSTRALALAQVVAGRLAGLGRVAEHAEHVVAQLERLAERQAVAPSRPPAGRRRRAGERAHRAAAGARRCTWRSCSGSPVRARSTRCCRAGPAAGRLEHVEVLPAHQLGAHQVEDRPGRGRASAGSGPRSRSSSSHQARQRSPARIAAAVAEPVRRRRPSRCSRCSAASRAVRGGHARGGCRCRP